MDQATVGQIRRGRLGTLLVALLALVFGAGFVGATSAEANTPTPPPPHWTLSPVSGDWQQAHRGELFPEPVVVSVSSTIGGRADVPVTFTVDTGVTFLDGSATTTVTTPAHGVMLGRPGRRAVPLDPFMLYLATATSSYGSVFFRLDGVDPAATPIPPITTVVVAGDHQTVAPGQPFQPLTARVQDGVPGYPV